MTGKKEFELKIVKFIDYIYLINFILNTLSDRNLSIYKSLQDQTDNDWKIFSTHCVNESLNILYLLKAIKLMPNYNCELLLLSIHIYAKICEKYAHQIKNYTYLFASVYIAVNKIIRIILLLKH